MRLSRSSIAAAESSTAGTPEIFERRRLPLTRLLQSKLRALERSRDPVKDSRRGLCVEVTRAGEHLQEIGGLVFR